MRKLLCAAILLVTLGLAYPIFSPFPAYAEDGGGE